MQPNVCRKGWEGTLHAYTIVIYLRDETDKVEAKRFITVRNAIWLITINTNRIRPYYRPDLLAHEYAGRYFTARLITGVLTPTITHLSLPLINSPNLLNSYLVFIVVLTLF